MNDLADAAQVIAGLPKADRATLLRVLAEDLFDAFPGIEATPGICGGEPRVVRTRIPVRQLVEAREAGLSEAALLAAYPTLTAEDLVNTWHYYRGHHAEIDALITENREAE
ncbi:MAG: DUF433 domain-containing protein [Betaproteobacteria bacterium]|nr:DUF433 domain-containing protein [Betaproteobacteria bacterium]